MSITGELREWMDRTTVRFDDRGYLLGTDEELTAIADRIDAVYETAMSRTGQLLADVEKDRDYNYANWQECKQKVLQHNITIGELDAKIESLEDELLHCVELPKDLYGEYIHEHDKVDWRDRAGTWHENAIVVAVCNDGCYVMDGTVFHVHKSDIRHHHAPTVEDVLREFADEMNQNLGMYTGEAIEADEWRDADAKTIAEYAAKLRLAEVEDA